MTEELIAIGLNMALAHLIKSQEISARIALRQATGAKFTLADLNEVKARSDAVFAELDAAIEKAEAEGR